MRFTKTIEGLTVFGITLGVMCAVFVVLFAAFSSPPLAILLFIGALLLPVAIGFVADIRDHLEQRRKR